MEDNLYDTYEPVVVNEVAVNNSQPTIFDYIDFSNLFNGFGFDSFLYILNVFTLAFTFFYSLVFMGDFFFYRVRNNGGEVEREQKGVSALYLALQLWWTYAFSLTVYLIYKSGGFLMPQLIWGILTALIFIIKIFFVDLPLIPVFGDAFKGPSEQFQKLFQFNFKSK
jgi:hypothetical protein